jgi:DNA-binding MarR family transcriptional regulator
VLFVPATLSERVSPTRSEELELAGLLLATLPRLGKFAAAAHEQSSISVGRAGVMWQLRERASRSGDLAQRCVMTAPALTELVDSLERDGLARRLEDPNDRRVVLVELTARGRRELDRFRDHMRERVARVLSNMSAEKRARLRSALADLHDAMEAITRETASAR